MAVALVALWGLLLRFVAPGLLRDAIGTQLAELTGRPASVERIEIEPYALVFRLHGLKVGEQSDGSAGAPARSHARLALLEADLSWRSLRHLAPVLERLVLVEPAVFVARDADGVYDGTDIVERLAAPGPEAPPETGPARFSVANIELRDGSAGLDDRKLDVRHEATAIGLRIPFVSSLPVDQEIRVEPGLELTLDGAPIQANGQLLPFADTRTGELAVKLESFDLTRWLPHLPELPVKLVSAALASELTVAFAAPEGEPAQVTVRGKAGLGGVELRQPDDRALLKLPALELADVEFDLLGSRLSVGRLAIGRPEIAIERRAGEARFLEPVMRALETRPVSGAGAPPAAQADSPAGRLSWFIGTIAVDEGRLLFDDRAFSPKPLRFELSALQFEASGLGQPQAQPAALKLSARGGNGEMLAGSAQLALAPLAVDGEASLAEVPAVPWAWLVGPSLALDVRAGELAASTRFQVRAADGSGGQAVGWKLTDGKLGVRSLALADGKREVVRAGGFSVERVAVDPASRSVSVGSVALGDARIALRRDATAAFDAAGWWRAAGAPGEGAGKGGSSDPGGSGSQGGATPTGDDEAWRVAVDRVEIDGSEVVLEYAAVRGERFPPLRVGAIAVEARDFATDSKRPVQLTASATVGQGGRLSARGTVMPATGAVSLTLAARSLPLPAAQPWLPPQVNASLASGALSADGRLRLSVAAGREPRGDWQGALAVTDLNARLKREAAAAIPAAMVREGADPADLLSWKSLRLSATRVTFSPLFVDLGDIELAGLRSRLVIQPNGRFNLQEVIEGPNAGGANGKPAPAGGAASAAASAGGAGIADGSPDGRPPLADDGPPMPAAEAPAARSEPPPKTDPPPLRIGRIELADGNVDFSDYFIQPNYSANLTGLAGSVGEMGGGKVADLKLDGRIDNTGSVTIAGRIDPIGEPLFLDLRADARDIDLPALSPYSGKYVGYGIKKGKLSASVEYRVESGQLSAQNQIVLDQLTFGEPVESPDALKLPVLFAVSLLKDRNGVIDVRLPISGSLDDPQFSIGGIVLRIIGNLIVKAVAAPFSLIAGLVGGSAEELSRLDFAPAGAALDDKARERLAALAKALTERPGLKLDVAGRWTAADRQAMQLAQLEARLKRIRHAMAGTDEKLPITAEQRPALLSQAWLMGRVPAPAPKDLPSAEAMQKELVEATALPDGALRELANRRAQAVKDWLAADGGIEPGRLFLTAPKEGGAADPEQAAGVELSLK
ncbi:DUF748 domain-containing protein [Burkholderiaceae bacterium FT117]|uniref:DUF748 domain-containing protein n=1 Tax=Zeimonas sediminis TaxID=2944268 RepID=UPI002342F7EB|nr:DUF748 domain-containing protein [Zeimonas sediminis]MCM5570645.1 DUF748 domain-containing protein [Zeimonas sediminis]